MTVQQKIEKFKRDRNAVILVHNYQLPEVQDIADYLGDSLGLSRQAARTEADVIVFCGVSFMAETAKILSPHKAVLLPDKDAGCPMADMVTADQLQELKRQHPNAKVVCYVNSSAEVKAESDLCCTSANALDLIEHAFSPDEEVIFVPDKYLATYTASVLKRRFIVWNGYCPSHVKILPEHIARQREMHPGAKVMVHPECTPEVTAIADAVLSTEGMCRYARQNPATEFIVGTEKEMTYRLVQENPGKQFYPASEAALCPNMKKTTLEKVLWSLEKMQYQVELPQDIMDRARGSIEAMLKYSAKLQPAAGV